MAGKKNSNAYVVPDSKEQQVRRQHVEYDIRHDAKLLNNPSGVARCLDWSRFGTRRGRDSRACSVLSPSVEARSSWAISAAVFDQ